MASIWRGRLISPGASTVMVCSALPEAPRKLEKASPLSIRATLTPSTRNNADRDARLAARVQTQIGNLLRLIVVSVSLIWIKVSIASADDDVGNQSRQRW